MLGAGPIHPYELQRRMKLWGKDLVVNLTQRANLYKTIDRLQQSGLIAVRQTERDQRFPERTIYELTEAGARLGRAWLVEMLAMPRNEFPRFPAALSFIMMLPPDEALGVLTQRAELVRQRLARLDAALADAGSAGPPRVTLLDGEFVRATTRAELAWLDGLLAELRSGALSWSREELIEAARSFLPEPEVSSG
jgi:DNA-binding PadR family transcriptional regulator